MPVYKPLQMGVHSLLRNGLTKRKFLQRVCHYIHVGRDLIGYKSHVVWLLDLYLLIVERERP